MYNEKQILHKTRAHCSQIDKATILQINLACFDKRHELIIKFHVNIGMIKFLFALNACHKKVKNNANLTLAGILVGV